MFSNLSSGTYTIRVRNAATGCFTDYDSTVTLIDPNCISTLEICDNGIDDDGDGLIDNLDATCSTAPDPCTNVIPNPQFDEALTGWEVRTEDGSTASMSIVNTSELSGPNAAKISITEETGIDWHIQLILSLIHI